MLQMGYKPKKIYACSPRIVLYGTRCQNGGAARDVIAIVIWVCLLLVTIAPHLKFWLPLIGVVWIRACSAMLTMVSFFLVVVSLFCQYQSQVIGWKD